MPEYVVGKFTDAVALGEPGSGKRYICTSPSDHGKYIFLEFSARAMFDTRPKYLVEVTHEGKRSRHGKVIASLPAIQGALNEALKSATWERDTHGRPKLMLETPFGDFTAQYDSGYRSNGADVDPQINLFPAWENPYHEALTSRGVWFASIDRELVRRAGSTSQRGATTSLGDLLREKHGL